MNTIPVLLDTDIGSDIDDAVALAYLLRQPRCELVGITTVTGDVVKRAALAQITCERTGKTNVPIHCGATTPLLWGPGQPAVPHYEMVKHHSHNLSRPQNSVVDFLRQTIRDRPGEITLLSIGPLTNIALLFALDPEIPSLLGGFVSMAGVFYQGKDRQEWNCLVDPIATGMVYNATGSAKIPNGHLSVGLDVTLECRMPADEVRSRFKPKPLDVVLEMAGSWFQHSQDITFHDPLAAALIFKPELCKYESGNIQVEVSNEKNRGGITTLVAGTGHRVAKTVDREKFFAEYFSVFD
jgi:purine nucleosidase